MYSPFCALGDTLPLKGEVKGTMPVPLLSASRTKRLVIGVVRCDPGKKERAPLDAVHFSSAIQNPRADGGLVYWKYKSTR